VTEQRRAEQDPGHHFRDHCRLTESTSQHADHSRRDDDHAGLKYE
jgi:hypothetical protein